MRSASPASPDSRVAGALLAAAGSVILMGIITAEALYPADYSTNANEIRTWVPVDRRTA
jgi:hypothetical protein